MTHPTRLSRRQFVRLAAAGLAAGAPLAHSANPPARPNADTALAKLLEGNKRFAGGKLSHPRRKPEDFAPLAEGQTPIACIVGCADSRVSPELLFDQGVGDLFVVRLAGNVVNSAGPTIKGSIEYAVAELGVPLVLVLGHSQCGAVKAAVKHIAAKDKLPGAIEALVEAIRPAVIKSKGEAGDALENAIRANVAIGVERLKALDPILTPAVKQGKVKVVGGVYDLKSGTVKVIA